MQRRIFAILSSIAVLLALTAVASKTYAATPSAADIADAKDRIGVYYLGGSYAAKTGSDTMPAAVEAAKKLGVRTIRITLSPLSDAIYYGTSSCIPSFNLAALAKRADFAAIISDPQFSTVIITTYDGTTLKNCTEKRYLNADYLGADTLEKIENEYRELAQYLSRFPSKKFIITNREGDNEIYCGAAYGATAAGCPGYSAKIDALKKWLTARHNGLRSAAVENVFSGVEFNIVRYLRDKGLPSVLYDIIPYVPSDYQLYSSYESINVNASRLGQDIDRIRESGATDLLIGEFGYTADPTGEKLASVAKVLKEKDVPIGIIWDLLSQTGFGLYEANGNAKASAKRIFGEPPATASSVAAKPAPYGIASIQGYDQYWDTQSKTLLAGRYASLFGNFAARGNTIVIGTALYTPTYESEGQINFLLGPATGTANIIVRSASGATGAYRTTIETPKAYVPRPVVKDAKSFNVLTKDYANTFKAGETLILYGSFASDGNAVSINGAGVKISSQTASQIQVPLPAGATGQLRITVSNSAGESAPYSLSVVAPSLSKQETPAAGQMSSGAFRITRIRVWDSASRAYVKYAYPGMYLVLTGSFPQDGAIAVSLNGQPVTPLRSSAVSLTIPLEVPEGDHILTLSSVATSSSPIKIHVGR